MPKRTATHDSTYPEIWRHITKGLFGNTKVADILIDKYKKDMRRSDSLFYHSEPLEYLEWPIWAKFAPREFRYAAMYSNQLYQIVSVIGDWTRPDFDFSQIKQKIQSAVLRVAAELSTKACRDAIYLEVRVAGEISATALKRQMARRGWSKKQVKHGVYVLACCTKRLRFTRIKRAVYYRIGNGKYERLFG